MPARTADDYSDEQLRAAWASCRRATWPETFEEAMANQMCAALVRLQAWRTARRPAGYIAPAPAPRRIRVTVLPPGFIDHKRAAAGDRDDD